MNIGSIKVLIVAVGLYFISSLSIFAAYDMLQPPRATVKKPLPAWPFVVGAIGLNVLCIGLAAFIARRPRTWECLGLSRQGWLLLAPLSWAGGLACGIALALSP